MVANLRHHAAVDLLLNRADEVIELLLWRDARFESVMRNKTDSADCSEIKGSTLAQGH
jgi:hypothetical protein